MAERNDGLPAASSLRAIIMRLPIFGSVAQDGISPQRIVESFHLAECVLAGGGIHHQQGLVGRTRDVALRGAGHLFQLSHQAGLGVQTARRVDDQHVDAEHVLALQQRPGLG
jgi:hypothetical protein